MLKIHIGQQSAGAFEVISLDNVKDSIRALSGGPVTIGTKGLIYGTSALECYLSQSDALWPGDVDSVLWSHTTNSAVALLEFKKHTLTTPISSQELSSYYPNPDGRKYNRLAVLRDHLSANLPLFVIYYPTNTMHDTIKIERVVGPYGGLRASKNSVFRYNRPLKNTLGDRATIITLS